MLEKKRYIKTLTCLCDKIPLFNVPFFFLFFFLTLSLSPCSLLFLSSIQGQSKSPSYASIHATYNKESKQQTKAFITLVNLLEER